MRIKIQFLWKELEDVLQGNARFWFLIQGGRLCDNAVKTTVFICQEQSCVPESCLQCTESLKMQAKFYNAKLFSLVVPSICLAVIW